MKASYAGMMRQRCVGLAFYRFSAELIPQLVGATLAAQRRRAAASLVERRGCVSA